MKLSYYILTLSLFLFSCKKEKTSTKTSETQKVSKEDTLQLVNKISSEASGLDFVNVLQEDKNHNYYKYMYTYIGGGVAVGDFNNDGFIDAFFTANTSKSKIYKNEGNLKFKEITPGSGIDIPSGFTTGVTTVDINDDGLLDIYVCRGGADHSKGKFRNLLFINQGNFKFKEAAENYGLADANRSIQATFFDYDNDGDLDVYIANTPDMDGKSKEIIDLDTTQDDPASQKLLGSDKLYKNNGNGKFTDVSKQAGLHYDIGFGLNPQVGDLNGDGFLDIYVCNDFKVPDFVYINNGNGTFTDKRKEVLKHMSFNSMGSDITDLNDDGLFDIVTLDMNPEDYVRSKTTMAMTSIPNFEKMVANKYHYNYMHNMLQINNGNGTFSEIGNMAGIANTDWSWAVLAADFDLDGLDDLYITNGVYRDVIDRDANNRILEQLRANQRKPTDQDFLEFTKQLPQQKLQNYFFKNNGDLTLTDVSTTWANETPTFSNGAAYADFDNDGDLDIVVNNINEPVTFLKNNSIELKKGKALTISLIGNKKNAFGIGSTVKVIFTDSTFQKKMVMPTRGFLSASTIKLHFGYIPDREINTIEVRWADGKYQKVDSIPASNFLTINYKPTHQNQIPKKLNPLLFKEVKSNIVHQDPYFNDYSKQILLPYKYSHLGPALAMADINSDGFNDFYFGGGHGQAGSIFLGNADGKYIENKTKVFLADQQREDTVASFFDVDNDGDLDLYVGSGSYEFSQRSKVQQDRLYINDGKANFQKANYALPLMGTITSVVTPCDYDNDGDMDLFIGSRIISGAYPIAPKSFLLENNNGIFKDITSKILPQLQNIGMITSAVWYDFDTDQFPELLVTGEWMGIHVFKNNKGTFSEYGEYANLKNTKGWWYSLLVDDIDNDGDADIIAGNLGLNTKFKASNEKPFHVYAKDFDYNGTSDVVLAKEYNGKQVPIRGKTCTAQQNPHLAQKIKTYNEFAKSNIESIYGKGIQSALHYEVSEFRSGIFYNKNRNFEFQPFPKEVQQSLINTIVYEDLDQDGKKDFLLAGNNYHFEVETTRADAGIGNFLKGNGNGTFKYISNSKHGFFSDKDVRKLVYDKKQKQVLVGNNNARLQIFGIMK